MIMTLTKVRNALSVGLGIISMVALALAVIGHYEKKALYAELDQLGSEIDSVVAANKQQQGTIDYLISQRDIDDLLLGELEGALDRLSNASDAAKKELEDLKNADSDFARVLNMRHPVSVNRLLNSIGAANSSGDKGTETSATAGAKEGM
ncbi:hypothetical protein [Vibrio phage VpKK5]|uniref:hypothetical protein n=1 Tax=Vibrio phage VpKK5 TaxID=1538804 RepID=UPI000535F75A|nr:hypothetical protein VC55_gp61 [Vibrio phage VpKK5]AIX97015.1 hypothetical protein [Vibrio phage VpKK5]